MINTHHTNHSERSKKITIQVSEANELLKFIIDKLPGKSRNSLKSFLVHRQIKVDNKIITRYNHPLKPGQQVVIQSGRGQEEFKHRDLKILFEDRYIIVVDKKAGLLSISTATEQEKTAYSILNSYVKKENPKNRIFVVHRLDRDTSGVMMFVKSSEVQHSLRSNWKESVKERNYIAVVEGFVEKDEDSVTSWLKESKDLIMFSSRKTNDGEKATTHYKVIKKNKKYSLLSVTLETGKKNQIRVHMQDIGHSIAGDVKYGSTSDPVKRLCLHANVLSFIHPVTKKEMKFESPVPNEFVALCDGKIE